MVSKTRNILEGSMKWILSNRNSLGDEFEEMGKSPSSRKNWIPELSPIANVVIRSCSRIIGISMYELRDNFDEVASDSVKHSSRHARNFLEYCCFQALHLSIQVGGHLCDKKFRRLTYDMMLAWETPAASNQPLLKVHEESTVGGEAFSRITPAIPTISNVITCDYLFDLLTTSTGGRLHFSVYDKYLSALERSIKKMKTQSESSQLSVLRSPRQENILEVDGTITTQPVLQHLGVSTWPGRLTLTDHAFYFETLRVMSYDKPRAYDLSDALKQVVKPELSGPWGTRLFDKAVMYKSISIPEVIVEFPELKGHSRRDYWLAIIREILYAHKFIRKFRIEGVERAETLLKATLGILRLQAVHEVSPVNNLCNEMLLMFSLCDQLPGGDLILESLARTSMSRRSKHSSAGCVMYSMSALAMMSNVGLVFGMGSTVSNDACLLVGEIVVGEMTPLERAVLHSRNSFKKVELAQATVDGVKVEGIDTNLAVMKELLYPMMELGKYLHFLYSWDDALKSLGFCSLFTYVIYRGWVGYALALIFLFIAIFILLTRLCNQGRPVDYVKVTAPPAMNTMEQLLAVQNAISQFELLVQDANIALLKLRALLMSVSSQASEKLALALLLMALVFYLLPCKYIVLLVFLDIFTRSSPPRKAITERWERRMREWWFSIPAAPVVLEKTKEAKGK